MGYTTDFSGRFKITPTLKEKDKKYLITFSNTRRMKRDVNILQKLYNGEYGFNNEYGNEGEYFCKDDGQSGQSKDESIIDYNTPAGQLNSKDYSDFNKYWKENEKLISKIKCQPSLWCDWIPNETGEYLQWNGGEKFYCYIQWLEYIIKHFLKPLKYKLNGTVHWTGEDELHDIGTIKIKDNRISINNKHIGKATFLK